MGHAHFSLNVLGTTMLALTSISRTGIERSRPLAPVTITLASTTVVGGVGTKATIALASVAPSGGTIVTVASAPPVTIRGGTNQVSLAGQIGPASIRVPQGATQVTIDLFTAGVATIITSTITVKSGADSSVVALTIRPASILNMSLSPTTVTGGQSPTLRVVLDGAAPGGAGVDASLMVSQGTGGFGDGSVRMVGTSLAVNAPVTVHFPPGSSTITVPVPTNPVLRDQSVILALQLGNSASAGLTIKAPVASSLSLQPNVVLAGNQAQALLALSGPAPAGFVVPIATTRPDVTVSSPIAVSEGSTSVAFSVTTSPTTATASPVTVTVGVPGPQGTSSGSIPDGTSNTIQFGELPLRVSAALSVVPPGLELFTLRPTTLKGGTNVIAAFKLPSTATGSRVVTLSTDHPELISLPATITVPTSPVATPFTFKTQPVTAQTAVTVTAAAGPQQIAVRLTIVP